MKSFGSVTLDLTHSQTPVQVRHIVQTIIEMASGKKYVIQGGYLDIGIIDTMKDLFVNFIGAIVFSVIGYFSVKNRDHNTHHIFGNLRLRPLSDNELNKQREEIERLKDEKEGSQ